MELKVLLSSSSKGISLMQFEYQLFRKGNGISQNEEKQRDLFDMVTSDSSSSGTFYCNILIRTYPISYRPLLLLI